VSEPQSIINLDDKAFGRVVAAVKAACGAFPHPALPRKTGRK